MKTFLRISVAILLAVGVHPARAVESPTVAGPIGGTDIRSATLPPAGFYGGIAVLGAATLDFVDKDGRTIPALSDAHLSKEIAAPFFLYVPEAKVLGGSVSVSGYVPLVNNCGHLFAGTSSQCDFGIGDPYIEFGWSRSFAKPRASKYPNAFPILEGLTVMAGLGVVLPVGEYTTSNLLAQVNSPGSNIWDFAPTAGFTYTTRPILAEGTEISVRVYWNSYLENQNTHYATGDILDIDFAITEHIGPLQIGIAGLFATQVEDDKAFGLSAPPNGNQAEIFGIGGVAAYDFPDLASSVKLKVVTSAPHAENTVKSWSATLAWLKKF